MIISSLAQLERIVKSKLYYLACPYTAIGLEGHAAAQVRHDRFLTITHIAARLMAEHGLLLLTPITASHGIHIHDPTFKLGGAWEQWKALDEKQIECVDGGVIVVMMPGWKESTGVTAEIKHAHKHAKSVYYLEPEILE
jgi:hypothetical protein